MKHGSLFSGIGGFDLASEWMGWENLFHCEINEFCQKILKHYWPNAITYGDITKTDFTIWRGKIDILTGGFPCQPYSLAGKRKGKEDERHLWPEMLRAIREISPSYVVGENVGGIVNWNGGLVFDEVQTDLENEGYEIQPIILPACSVNAPHRRDRIWFVAYGESKGSRRELFQQSEKGEFRRCNCLQDATATSSKRCYNGGNNWEKGCLQGDKRTSEKDKSKGNGRKCGIGEVSTIITNSNGRRQSGKEHRKEKPGQFTKKSFSNYWENFPTQSPICGRNDGLPSELDGITFPKWRNESIKGYGNAIVPQVVYEIFKVIEKISQGEALQG